MVEEDWTSDCSDAVVATTAVVEAATIGTTITTTTIFRSTTTHLGDNGRGKVEVLKENEVFYHLKMTHQGTLLEE